MEQVAIDKLADELIVGLKEAKAEIGAVHNVQDAIKLVPFVVKRVEEISGDLKLAGSQKRDLAVAIINKLVDIPWVPEALEGKIIGMAVDAIIAAFNRYLGKSWLGKLSQ